jgi:hypothetical protein
MNSNPFSRRQFLAVAATVCVADASTEIFAKMQKPTRRVENEDMVCEIWDAVKANKPLSAEMLRHIEDTDESGETVVSVPAYTGNPQALKRLLEYGADPTYVSPYGDVRKVLQDNINEIPQEIIQECLRVLDRFQIQ